MNTPCHIPCKQSKCFFPISCRSPVRSSDHAIINVHHMIGSHTNHRHFTHSCDHIICSQSIMNEMVSQPDFSLALDTDVSVSWDQITNYLNFCFNPCYPVETPYIRPDCFSSSRLTVFVDGKNALLERKITHHSSN